MTRGVLGMGESHYEKQYTSFVGTMDQGMVAPTGLAGGARGMVGGLPAADGHHPGGRNQHGGAGPGSGPGHRRGSRPGAHRPGCEGRRQGDGLLKSLILL